MLRASFCVISYILKPILSGVFGNFWILLEGILNEIIGAIFNRETAVFKQDLVSLRTRKTETNKDQVAKNTKQCKYT